MNFVYLTTQIYPSKKVEPFYHKSMAGALARALDEQFVFVVRGQAPQEIAHTRPLSVPVPVRFKTIFCFFYLPLLVARRGWSGPDTVFFSYDPYLAAVLIFWRPLLRWRSRVAFDWHQLFEDWRDGYLARGCDRHLTTSLRLKNLLVSRFGVLPARVEVAYGGVDSALYIEKARAGRAQLRAELGLPADGYLVGYVGGFTSVGLRKGLDTMLEALPLLPEEVRMAFVGGSAAEIAEYQALAKELGVAERCIFVQRQPFEKVVEYQLAMDSLVIPYPDLPHFREWGFPMKVWEYMAAGRPVVYSNLELIGEVLEGRAAPFAPGSPQSLAEALLGIYTNRAAAELQAARNPAAVESSTWEGRARRIVEFLNQ